MKSAFPNRHKGSGRSDSHIEYFDEGMTLRDYFAAMALIERSTDYKSTVGEIADRCYRLADAMMEARKKEPDHE